MRAALLGAATAVAVLVALAGPARRWTPSRPRGRPSLSRHRRPALLLAAVAVGLVLPWLPPLAALGWWARRRVRAQRATTARVAAVRLALPDAVDLLVLASTAGLSLPMALPRVAEHAATPVGPALRAAEEAAAAGALRADALRHHLTPLGERARALADVLVDHLRYGVPLLPALERTGLELRLDRRRAAEQEARRVPVRLLAPLVTCVLPAFALLTVIPLLAASLEALPT